MKKNWRQIAIGAIVIINVVCFGAVAWLRLHDFRQFRQTHSAHTYGGTNYTVELLATTVGKVESGVVVIVDIQLHNPNPFEVVLRREWFVLLDHEKEYFEPLTLGAIHIPANGTVDKETLNFAVPDEALAGVLALEVGRDNFAMLKSPKPFTQPLTKGQFIMFRHQDW